MGFFNRISEQYKDLWKAIIRPPRDRYKIEDIGPEIFPLGTRTFQRTDFEVRNPRGLKLICSHFEPLESERRAIKLPAVIYLHGNCSSRIESLVSLSVLLPQNITVVALDFSGSGHSEGEYVSLGWFERDDLSTVIDHLRKSERTSCIGLWGRSMGAVTALMHGVRDPSIAGMVIDSPFSSLRRLAEELTDCYVAWKIPRFLVSTALSMLRSSILHRAKFDIEKLNPIEHAPQTFIPALFVCAEGDRFILPHHATEISAAYGGDMNLIEVKGDHNSIRPQFLHDSIAIFFHNTLKGTGTEERRVVVEDLWPKNFAVKRKKSQGWTSSGTACDQGGAVALNRAPDLSPPQAECCFQTDETGRVQLIDKSAAETDDALKLQHELLADLTGVRTSSN